MIELLYLSVLDDGERFQFVSLDTLAHPLDFQGRVSELQCEHECTAREYNLNWTEACGFFGPVEEVALFEDGILGEVYGFRMFPEFHYERKGDNEAFIQAACIELLRNQTPGSIASSYRFDDEEAGFGLILLAGSKSFLSQSHCKIALEQYAEAWLHQEQPTLLGSQVLTRGFSLNAVRGKRIIAPHFDPERHQWELFLEGARRLTLQGSDYYMGEQSDSSVVGSWTEPDVDSILLNPAYGFGVHFQSFEAVEGWLKSLLYCCALSFYSHPWTAQEANVAYSALLNELKQRFPYDLVPPIFDEDEFIEAFLECARRRAKALRGIEESALTSRFAAEMPTRTYQLKAVAQLVRDVLPWRRTIPAEGDPFNIERYRELLLRCDVPTNSEKGQALEDLAACLLSSLDGWLLAGKRVRADDCEIDLCYVNASLCQQNWDLGSLLLVECKNRTTASGVSVLRNLSFVMDAKGARSGIIISMAGFTQVLEEQVIRLATQGKTIILINGEDLQEMANGLPLEECLQTKLATIQNLVADDFAPFMLIPRLSSISTARSE